jgi:acetyl esterase
MTQDIDEGMLTFYKELSKHSPPESANWPLLEQRKAWDDVCRLFRAERPQRLFVEDIDVDGIHVRVFRPPGEAPKPAVIYFHGGGWVLGSCETHDDMCAEMAVGADCVVVLVDYRLAPEHPHPAQLEDSLKVLLWMRSSGRAFGIDSDRIVGAGDSAGGQMTVGLALVLRDNGAPQLRGQVLIYPVLGADVNTQSYIRNAHAPCLTKPEMAYDPKGLPPTYISVAGHDPLFDDGVIFYEKMRAAGIPAILREEPALAHSFMRARHVSDPAKKGFNGIVEALRSLGHREVLPD